MNDIEYELPKEVTIIQACYKLGIEIPHFCYHEKLSIAGNCRMCLVEVQGIKKPVPSCIQIITDGMKIYTKSEMVKKAREGVLEFILINHPLDCPICDKGGECSLQNYSMAYGSGRSRYIEDKRIIEDKLDDPLIETHMTRCIYCTRCIRFLDEIAGTNEMGLFGRGEETEITTNFIEKKVSNGLKSEISGNIIDICPVGALNSRTFAYSSRSWELEKIQSIDIFDAVGSNIFLEIKNNEIMRVLPRQNNDINEEWISDKVRFCYDGLKYQRIYKPMIQKNNKSFGWEELEWERAYEIICKKINETSNIENSLCIITGNDTDIETMFTIKKIFSGRKNITFDSRQNGSILDDGLSRIDYLFNTPIIDIEKADTCLMIGCSLNIEAPILNIRFRRAVQMGSMNVSLIGNKVNMGYPYKYIGHNPWLLKQISDGTHPYCDILSKSKRPILLLGSSALRYGESSKSILHYCKKIAKKYSLIREDWNGFNILHTNPATVGGLDIGLISTVSSEIEFTHKENHIDYILKNAQIVILVGADEINLSSIKDNTLVVYIGHHFDRSAKRANIILPSPAFTEKSSTYLNLEGRAQRTTRAVYIENITRRTSNLNSIYNIDAIEEWKILNRIGRQLGSTDDFTSIEEVRNGMAKYSTRFDEDKLGILIKNNDYNKLKIVENNTILIDEIEFLINDFYMNDTISRHSRNMAKASMTRNIK